MVKQNEKVSSIMTRSLITANVSDNLRQVTSLMKKHNVRHLPVVSDKKLVGIVSRTDIMRLSFGDMFDDQSGADNTIFDTLTLEQVMMSEPKTVDENDSIKDVAAIFSQSEFHALPVMNGDEVVGIISTTDLIRYLMNMIGG